jgi:8-oxo-dGTP pyrophosphatase MutT (NUDIX family)
MSEDLTTFLQQQHFLGEDTTTWGSVPLRFTDYLSQKLPPLDLITSVRAVVLRDETVLVIREPSSRYHILPGGRREAGETLLQTLRREVLEETGWALNEPALLGFRHYQHLGPEIAGFIYPDFFQAIYTASAQLFQKEAMIFDEYVHSSEFLPFADVRALALVPGEHLYLDAVLG